MSRTNNAIKNVSYNIGYQLLMLVMGFINRTLFLHFLNIEYLGVQSIFNDILQLLSMADLGLITAMTYSLYAPLANQDTHYISGLIHFYKRICNLIALFIFVVGLLVIPFIPDIVSVTTDMPLVLYYVMYLLNTVSTYLFVYKTVILAADQKGYVTAKYGSIFNVLQNICLGLFLWWTRNFFVYLIIQVAFTYIYNITVSTVASRDYPYINEKVVLPNEQTRGIFKNIQSMFIYKTSNVLVSATDNILISVLIGTATVGFYSNYMLVISKAVSLITTGFNSLVSSLGNLVIKEDKKRRYQVFQMIQTICQMLTLFVVVMMFYLLQDFMTIWLGQHYLLDTAVLYAIIVNFYLTIALLPVWIYREATGLFNQIKYVMLLTAIINLVVSYVLGQIYGLAGILLGTIIAKLLTYVWYEPILLFNRYFDQSSVHYFLSMGKSLLFLMFTGILCAIPAYFITVDNILTLFIKASLLLIITLSCILLFYKNSTGFKLLKQKFLKN